MKKTIFNRLLSIFLVFSLAGCSLFSPITIERHQWGSLNIPPGFQFIQQKQTNRWWELSYETITKSQFTGLVRHTSRINERQYPMLTHDILITTGDFSNTDIVRTNVIDHHFIWSSNIEAPQGRINLLHTMPSDEENLINLYNIQYGDTVTIVGYEIYEIQYYKGSQYMSMWKDAGCNTLLVTEVIIHETP